MLRPGGHFVFTTEDMEMLPDDEQYVDNKGYRLQETGRYAHSKHYFETDLHHFNDSFSLVM